MTRNEQLEAALGICLEALHAQLPSNPRLIPSWYVSAAAAHADKASDADCETLRREYAAAVSRLQQSQK
jgi:hypothetical protein